MEFSKIAELIKTLEIDEKYEVVITESSITIKEASVGPSLEEFVKMYISDDNIKSENGKYIIDTSGVMSAINFWKILTAAFNDKYEFSTEGEYTIIATPNTEGDIVNKSTNKGMKWESAEEMSLAKLLDEKGFNVIIKEDGSIEAFGENIEECAEELDSKFSNLNIKLFDEKFVIEFN